MLTDTLITQYIMTNYFLSTDRVNRSRMNKSMFSHLVCLSFSRNMFSRTPTRPSDQSSLTDRKREERSVTHLDDSTLNDEAGTTEPGWRW